MAGVFGRASELAVRRPRLTLREFHRLARGRVSVQSLADGRPSSRPAKARVKPVRKKRARAPRRR